MDIIKQLTDSHNGQYFEEELKKANTPGGAFISQKSYGYIKKDNYSIKIYSFANMGVRVPDTRDGSPFKIVLILPFVLKRPLSIFPKTFFQKIIGNSIPKSMLSPNAKALLKKYSLNKNKELTNYILTDSSLSKLISNHKIYLSTNIGDNNSTLSLRPNESVIEVEDLKALYDIMDRLGEIIIEHKSILKKQ